MISFTIASKGTMRLFLRLLNTSVVLEFKLVRIYNWLYYLTLCQVNAVDAF